VGDARVSSGRRTGAREGATETLLGKTLGGRVEEGEGGGEREGEGEGEGRTEGQRESLTASSGFLTWYSSRFSPSISRILNSKNSTPKVFALRGQR
jgi:hypothetical protein